MVLLQWSLSYIVVMLVAMLALQHMIVHDIKGMISKVLLWLLEELK